MATNEILIKFRTENAKLKKDLAQSQKIIRDQGKRIAEGLNEVNDSSQKMSQNAGLAGAAAMSLGGALSDMQYGLRGVANNLQQFVALFGMLSGKTKGFKGAMKELAATMMGPIGVVIALQTVISLLGIYQERQRKAKKEAGEANDELIEDATNLRALGDIYNNAYASIEAREEAFRQLKKELPELNDLEWDNVNAIKAANIAIERNIQMMVLRERANSFTDSLVAATEKVEELQAQLKKAQDRYSDLGKKKLTTAVAEEMLDLQVKIERLTKKTAKAEAERAEINDKMLSFKYQQLELQGQASSLAEDAEEAEKRAKKAANDRLKYLEDLNSVLASQLKYMEKIGDVVDMDDVRDVVEDLFEREIAINLRPKIKETDKIEFIDVSNIENAQTVSTKFEKRMRSINMTIQDLNAEWGKSITDTFALLSSMQRAYMDQLRDEEEFKRRAIMESTQSEANKLAQLAALDQEYSEKRRKAARKAAIAEKAQALFSAIVNGAAQIAATASKPWLAALTAGIVAAQVGVIAATPIPKLAEGGLAHAPTLAMVGDNKNAGVDPEVIAPLSKLRGMIGGGSVEVTGRISGETIFLQQQRVANRHSRTRL